MDEARARLARGGGEQADRGGVDGVGGCLLALGLVDRGISGGVEHQRGLHVGDAGADGGGVGDVERVDVVADDLGIGGRGRGEAAAELALAADDQHLHA